MSKFWSFQDTHNRENEMANGLCIWTDYVSVCYRIAAVLLGLRRSLWKSIVWKFTEAVTFSVRQHVISAYLFPCSCHTSSSVFLDSHISVFMLLCDKNMTILVYCRTALGFLLLYYWHSIMRLLWNVVSYCIIMTW